MEFFSENLGAPKSPLFNKTNINPKVQNPAVPQAWSLKIQDVEYWYYNYIGALSEAEFLGARLPTWAELEWVISKFPNIEKAIKQINLMPVGFVRMVPWEKEPKLYGSNTFVELWTSDVYDIEADPNASWDGEWEPPESRDCFMINVKSLGPFSRHAQLLGTWVPVRLVKFV